MDSGSGQRLSLEPSLYKSKPLLSDNEKEFFQRLSMALPDCHIFTQVALGALLQPNVRNNSSAYYRARATFFPENADYVICNKEMTVLAVVELDDRTIATTRMPGGTPCLCRQVTKSFGGIPKANLPLNRSGTEFAKLNPRRTVHNSVLNRPDSPTGSPWRPWRAWPVSQNSHQLERACSERACWVCECNNWKLRDTPAMAAGVSGRMR